MTAKTAKSVEPTRSRKTRIALCTAAAALLLAYQVRSHGREDEAPVEAHGQAARAVELAFPELLEDESASTRASGPGVTDGPGRSLVRRVMARPDEGSRPAEPGPLYDDEMAYYLGTFLGEAPDILGWVSCLGVLAASAELDRESLSRDGHVLRGDFVIAGNDTRVAFSIAEDGYRILVTNDATMRVLGKKSSASLSFESVDGSILRAYGVVQFFPEQEQRYYEDGPVGYMYGTTDGKTLFRPIRQDLRDGRPWVTLPPPSPSQRLEAGDLGPAYLWMERLQDVERSHSRREG